MKRFILLYTALAVCLANTKSQEVPPLPRHGQLTSRVVAGDPDRCLQYVWSIDGGLTGPYKLTGPDGQAVPVSWERLPRTSDGYKDTFHGGFRLSDRTAKEGGYVLDVGRGNEFFFRVTASPPPRKVYQAPNHTSARTISGHLSAGEDVELTGNYYEWTEPVVLPPYPRTLRAYGATIKRVDNGNPNDYRQRMFWGGKDFTLEGGTWYPVESIPVNLGGCGVVFHAGKWSGAPGQDDDADPESFTGTGFVIKNATFRSGDLGYSMIGVQVKDCLFDKASCNDASMGLWLRNEHRGRGPGHAWRHAGGSPGRTALIDATFDNTDRGPVFDTRGPVTNCLFLSTVVSTRREINGCESFLCESDGIGEFSKNTIFNTRIYGNGCCPMFDAPASDNFVHDLMSEGPGGCIMWGTNVQERNRLSDCEWGGYLYLGAKASNNQFNNCGWRWIGPSRANQGGLAIDYYDTVKACVTSLGANNKLSSCRFFLPTGLEAAIGVSVDGGKANGKPMPDVQVPNPVPAPGMKRRR